MSWLLIVFVLNAGRLEGAVAEFEDGRDCARVLEAVRIEAGGAFVAGRCAATRWT